MDEKRRVRVMAALNACFNYASQHTTYETNQQEGNVIADANTVNGTSANTVHVLSNVKKVANTRMLSYDLTNKITSPSLLTSPQKSNSDLQKNAQPLLNTQTTTTTIVQ